MSTFNEWNQIKRIVVERFEGEDSFVQRLNQANDSRTVESKLIVSFPCLGELNVHNHLCQKR